MKKKTAAIAGVASAAVLVAGSIVYMSFRTSDDSLVSSSKNTAQVIASTTTVPSAERLAGAIRNEGLLVDSLIVTEMDGILLIRGRAPERATIARIGQLAAELGHPRVANLVVHTPAIADDEIERTAERELAESRSLEGCRLSVSSKAGVVLVSGKVRQDLQREAAASLLRNLPGVREVRTDLARF